MLIQMGQKTTVHSLDKHRSEEGVEQPVPAFEYGALSIANSLLSKLCFLLELNLYN